MATHIDLIRHGEPVGGRMYRGSGTNHPLSETGWQQMQASVDKHRNADQKYPWQLIISSPMARCWAFAEQLSKQHNIPLIKENRFIEAYYGSWEGKTHQQVKEATPEAFRKFYEDPVYCRPPNAERLETFYMRVDEALDQVFDLYNNQNILLISHAGVMRCIISLTLNAATASQQKIRIPYAGMVRVSQEDDRRQTLSIL